MRPGGLASYHASLRDSLAYRDPAIADKRTESNVNNRGMPQNP